ncbi:hypothetical protein [Cellulomonas dongxiuzhuiae]|uniref:Transposase n=1 Tax=Cellulomonas dongxiuzhuiae TaxID=2819979 RepID=A0ABX8GKA2_9CELL|nr:hypothetical protein [Cellulomonas dongxiuzhuiae]MBO3095552.1 hypothetical protein [Cellulomonas dongxiuzhuiae]QWC16524.1 hypothetical protein KKR89_02305 [Cellulomonas dongxiuzhuiae]
MDNNNAITHRIATYRPRLLSADAWTHAAAPVRAALTAAAPKNPEDAKVLGSSLCAFLASPCGWHPGEVPDLRALLSDAAIERFAAGFTGPQGTRQNHIRRLLTLQRAVAEVPREPAIHRALRRRAAPAPAALRTVCSRSSLPTVAALAERLSGHRLSYFRLEGLIATARPSIVTGIPAGTVPVDRDVLGAYLDADDVQLMTEVVRATTPTNTKKTSQRQQLAQARADRAAYRRATQGPRAAAHPDMAPLEPAVRSAIETYRPQTLDDRARAALRPLTVQMVAGFEPPSVVSARNAATIVVAFLQWVWSLPNRPEPAAAPTALELLSGPFVEMYASRVRTGEARRGSAASTTADVIAIDASSLPSWSRGARQVRATKGEDYRLDDSTFVLNPTQAWDPDARWGYQTATHNKYDAKRFFGYQMLTVSTSFAKGSPEQPLKLITAMKLVPGNASVAGPALRMIDSLMARQPVSEVIVDRGFSMATHDHWADPVLQRGLDQVFDLAEVQRGPVLDHQTGVMMIDGWPCAPWTPRHLHKIARPPRFALKKPGPNANPKHTAEYETNLAALRVFQAAQAELEQYALVPNGRRKTNGTRHFFAPTHGRDTATAASARRRSSSRRRSRFRGQSCSICGSACAGAHRHGPPSGTVATASRAATATSRPSTAKASSAAPSASSASLPPGSWPPSRSSTTACACCASGHAPPATRVTTSS